MHTPPACHLVLPAGRDAAGVGSYVNRVLRRRDVATVPKPLSWITQRWVHDQLTAAGVDVMFTDDAAMSAIRSRQRRVYPEQAPAAPSAAAGKSKNQGSGQQQQQ